MGVGVEVIEPCGFILTDRGVARAAMDYGALAQLTLRSGWAEFHAEHRAAGRRLVLFTTKGARPLHDFTFAPDDVLLFGRESAGVPDDVHDAADARVIIPITPPARSLNVTVSAAIGLAEALRQTGQFPTAAS